MAPTKKKPIDEQLAFDWWHKDGRFIDPDESAVPWHDKRHLLAQIAYQAGFNAAMALHGTSTSLEVRRTLPLVLYFGDEQGREEFLEFMQINNRDKWHSRKA